MIKMYMVRATPNPAASAPAQLETELVTTLEQLVPSLTPIAVLSVAPMPSLNTKRTANKLACVGECYEFTAATSGVRFAAIVGLDACREFNLHQQTFLEQALSWVGNEQEIKPAVSLRSSLAATLRHSMRGLATPCFKIHRLMGAIIIEVREAMTEEI